MADGVFEFLIPYHWSCKTAYRELISKADFDCLTNSFFKHDLDDKLERRMFLEYSNIIINGISVMCVRLGMPV